MRRGAKSGAALTGQGLLFWGDRHPPAVWLPKCGDKHCWKGVTFFEDTIDKVRDEVAPTMMKAEGTSLTANCRFIHIVLVGIS